MKKMLVLLGLAIVACSAAAAQRLTVAEFRSLAYACVPEADSRDLLALARTESSLNPWAKSVNRPAALARRLGYGSGRLYLKQQPKTRGEAIRWARELGAGGATVSVGVLQVNLERTAYSAERLLDPCANLQQGWNIFVTAYRREVLEFGQGQRALLAAFAAYNAGAPITGFTNGYVLSILRNSY
jgi:type IV secretion system protein VirB1